MAVFLIYCLVATVAMPVVFFVTLNLVTRGEREKGCLTFFLYGFISGTIGQVISRVFGAIIGFWGSTLTGLAAEADADPAGQNCRRCE